MNNLPNAGSQEEKTKGQQVKAAVRVSGFSGPLPPPDALEHYNRIVPGFAERLLTQFEQESQHTRAIEISLVRNEIRAGYFAQVFAFIIAIVGLVGAVYVAVNGAEWAATVIGGGTLAMIISAFLYSKKRKS